MMQLTRDNIARYSDKYDKQMRESDKVTEKEMKRALETQHYLTKKQLVTIGMWKSSRARKHYESNTNSVVEEVTAFSFSAKTEQARIGTLCVLNGVRFPVASVILHFKFPDRYPILDFRALWSLEWHMSTRYTYEFWESYCNRMRKIARQVSLPIRKIDKALWQYSKDHQR